MQVIDGELHSSETRLDIGREGTEIWHIEAPASLDISKIRQLTLEGIKDGKPIMSQGDNEYAFVQDSSENRRSTNAVIPSTQGGYRTAPQPIVQTFRLQLVVPSHPTSASSQPAPIKKPVRQQPENLKQRFRPLGAKRNREKTSKPAKTKRVKVES